MSVTEIAAGSDLDVEIARRVFRAKKVYTGDGKPWEGSDPWPYWIKSGRPWKTHHIDATPVPRFSTNMGAAWMIVEHMRAQGFTFEMQDRATTTHHDVWEVTFTPMTAKQGEWAWGDTPEMAICRAALSLTSPGPPAARMPGQGAGRGTVSADPRYGDRQRPVYSPTKGHKTGLVLVWGGKLTAGDNPAPVRAESPETPNRLGALSLPRSPRPAARGQPRAASCTRRSLVAASRTRSHTKSAQRSSARRSLAAVRCTHHIESICKVVLFPRR